MLCFPGLTPVANDAHAVGDSGECVVAEAMDAAGCARQFPEVRQLPLVHPFLRESRVHAVEPEDDELLAELLGSAPVSARHCRAERGDKQRAQQRFHRVNAMPKL